MPTSNSSSKGERSHTTPSAKPFSISHSTSSAPKSPKLTSFSLQPPSRPPLEPASRTFPRRPRHLRHESDSEDDEAVPTHEAVTGFDTQTGTAIFAEPKGEKRDLIIPVSSGNNWRDRPGVNIRRGKKNLLPREVQALREAKERGEDVDGSSDDRADETSAEYGLSFAEPRADADKEMRDAEPPVRSAVGDEQRSSLTQDEIALQALLHESKGETGRRSDLVIQTPAIPDSFGREEPELRYDETTSFRVDIASRPEPSSLDQYNAIPVEEFGAALLRGMGWKEGQPIGKGNYDTSSSTKKPAVPRIPERRPGFLGIGAKDLAGGKGAESEIGAWGKAAMRKGSHKGGDGRTVGIYMPVLMRNKRTGEYITEEELEAARKEAKMKGDNDSWKERRDRNLERSGRDRDRNREYRRRDYEDDSVYEKRRNRPSRRDRSLSVSDRDSPRRRCDDDNNHSSEQDDQLHSDKDLYKERSREHRFRDRDRRSRDTNKDENHKHRNDDQYGANHSSSRSSRHRDRSRYSDRGRV